MSLLNLRKAYTNPEYKNAEIIVAFEKSGGIGSDNSIPWKCKPDMWHFRDVTKGNIVIMGRKTWDSLPEKAKPLPDRVNIILTKDTDRSVQIFGDYFEYSDPVVCYPSLNMAIYHADKNYPKKKIFIIGGASIYKEAFNLGIYRGYYTKILESHKCDKSLPIEDYVIGRIMEDSLSDIECLKRSIHKECTEPTDGQAPYQIIRVE